MYRIPTPAPSPISHAEAASPVSPLHGISPASPTPTLHPPPLDPNNKPPRPVKPPRTRPPRLSIVQLNIKPRQNRRHDLIHLHLTHLPPNTNPRSPSKSQYRTRPLRHPRPVRRLSLAVPPQPPLRHKLIRILAEHGAVPPHDVRIHTDVRARGHGVGRRQDEAGGRHGALHAHGYRRVEAYGLADDGLEVREGAGRGVGHGAERGAAVRISEVRRA